MLKYALRMLRIALFTRHLFRNWLSAALRYLLIKYGLASGYVIVKCGAASYKLSPDLYSFVVNAYYDGLIAVHRCGDRVEFSIGGVIKLSICDEGAFFVTPDGVKLWADVFDYAAIFETWIYDIHFLGFNLDNWIVVDIGAFIGDTALYYASRGAFVVAVEPVPRHFEAMLRNIELNPTLKPRIVPVNAAIASTEGFVDVAVGDEIDGEASIYKRGVKTYRVKSYTLKSLIEHLKNLGIEINKFKVRALKMDCKGCEYDVVDNEPDVLKLFDVLKIEYSGHLRGYTVERLIRPIEDRLGFKCRMYAHNDIAVKLGLDKHGMITCVRRDYV